MDTQDRDFRAPNNPTEQPASGISSSDSNPFAPPPATQDSYLESEARGESPNRRPSITKSIVTWSLVCVLGAAPSFFWGFQSIAGNQATAMLCGIAVFICFYVIADQSKFASSMRRNRNARLAMRIAYGTRIAISVIFPVSLFMDAFIGMGAISLTSATFRAVGLQAMAPSGVERGSANFVFCFTTTLAQGCLLNCVLAAYGCVVLAIIVVIRPNSSVR